MTAKIRPVLPSGAVYPLRVPDSEKARQAAYLKGLDEGERTGHVNGWRIGFRLGLLYGAVLGQLLMMGAGYIGRLVG